MRTVGLGLIGLGFIGKVHLRNSLKLASANLVGVSDISKRALADAQKAGVRKTFTSYEQLLKDPQVEAVLIALPTHLHLNCAIAAAEAKKHVFLEKPIAKDVAEAKQIVSAAEKNSVKLMIGYPLRFNTIMKNLRQQIKTGVLGDIETAYATNVASGPFQHRAQDYAPTPVPEWWFKKELTGGGALIDLGSHMINLLRWYFGEVVSIESHLGHRFNMDFEDRATCLARFESGTLALINVGWFSQQFQLKVDVHGTMGHSSAANTPPNRILAAMQMILTKSTSFYQPYVAELNHFVNCILDDKTPSPSGIDGLRDLEAIESAYKNSKP